MSLNLHDDIVSLTASLVEIPSVSFQEAQIASDVESALRRLDHLDVQRIGGCVIAQTNRGHARTVILAGHLDTVPPADNERSRIDVDDDGVESLWGLGACDMKGGVAVMLSALATGLHHATMDVTAIFYDCEEVASEHNGLGKLAASHPDLLRADMAILLEPSNAAIEGGCQGTLRAQVRTSGVRAHTARAWRGVNAIHRAAEILTRLAAYVPRQPVIDGLQFHEGLQAVAISGGIAGNVVPDDCVVTVNFRFAPDRSVDDAIAHVREVFDGFDVTITDCAAGALPSLSNEQISDFISAMGVPVSAKLGWTDVARFAELGIPAVNFGPGNPEHAHAVDERVPVAQLRACADSLISWLSGRN